MTSFRAARGKHSIKVGVFQEPCDLGFPRRLWRVSRLAELPCCPSGARLAVLGEQSPFRGLGPAIGGEWFTPLCPSSRILIMYAYIYICIYIYTCVYMSNGMNVVAQKLQSRGTLSWPDGTTHRGQWCAATLVSITVLLLVNS